jgi:5-methylcytosine-specific restriction endonuclease McrA
MIPIDYTFCPKEYDKFVANFKKKVEKAISIGYVGQREKMTVRKALDLRSTLSAAQKIKFDAAINKVKNQRGWKKKSKRSMIMAPENMLDEDTLILLRLIQTVGDEFYHGNPKKLESYISVFETLYPEVRNKKNNIHKNLYQLFVENGFDAKRLCCFPKDKIIEAAGVKVCPYCNRVFVENIEFKTGGSLKGQLDHFYPKDKYPYLAISRYNLVPCCPFCNGSSCKGNKDPRKVKMVNPYSLKDAQGLRFKTNIRRKGFLNLETCASAVDVEVDVKKQPEMTNNNKVFHLAEIYNHHKDYVAEMWYRYNMMKTPAYQQFASEMLGMKAKRGPWKIRLSKSDWDRIIFGVYTEETDYHKRPMSKFCMDIVEGFKRKKM